MYNRLREASLSLFQSSRNDSNFFTQLILVCSRLRCSFCLVQMKTCTYTSSFWMRLEPWIRSMLKNKCSSGVGESFSVMIWQEETSLITLIQSWIVSILMALVSSLVPLHRACWIIDHGNPMLQPSLLPNHNSIEHVTESRQHFFTTIIKGRNL